MTKLIRKTQQPSDYPSNQIHDAYSTSTTDTYSCNYINEARLEEYSATEKIIGKWIDGKPLYGKTITFTSTISANATTSIAHNITNAKNIFIDYGASFMEANIGTNNYMSYSLSLIGYTGNITDKMYCYVNPVNINIYSNGSWGKNWTKHITLKYTKTTD